MKLRFSNQLPKGHKNCKYYQPHWTYRFCYYAVCPYKIRDSTIRSKPLKKKHFPPKEVVKMKNV